MSAYVTEAILAEASEYSVTRFAAGTRSLGVYSRGQSSTVAVVMFVQPMKGREAQVLPEGLRNRELVTCFATSEIRAADESAGTDGDRFTYNGEVFEVMQVADRSSTGGFWRAAAARVQD